VPSPTISRAELENAFAVLSERLVERATPATVLLFGDAAMMFAHDARVAIHHVDASAAPRGPVMGAARETAQRLDLPVSWFDDERAASLPKQLDDDVVELWSAPNLTVRTVGPEVLLAMTALAPNRPEDVADVRLLAALLGFTSSIDVEVLVAEIFPGRSLGAKARSTLDDLL
jgi:hypothetical protein